MISVDKVAYYQNMSQGASGCMRTAKYIMIIGVIGSLCRSAFSANLGVTPWIAAIGFVTWIGFDILQKKMRNLAFIAERNRELSYEMSHGRINAEVTSYMAGKM
jgi:hypothetical protein